jgi:hypothetical protein
MLGWLDQTGQNQSGKIALALVVGSYIFLACFAVLVVAVSRHYIRQTRDDRAEGITRFGSSTLQGKTLTIRGRNYDVTHGTTAEVVGAVERNRRSTVTRTVAGGVVAGPVGALAGHAAKKKAETSTAILAIDGKDWSESIPVGVDSYADAVRFAQAIKLAARTSTR